MLDGFEAYYLSNVTLIFLPANTTSIEEPLDQGIIAAFKAHYLRHLVKDTLASLEADETLTIAKVRPDMLTVLRWVHLSSRALSADTIRNCWFKAGILGLDKVPAPPSHAERRRVARGGRPAPSGLAAVADMLSADEDEEGLPEGGGGADGDTPAPIESLTACRRTWRHCSSSCDAGLMCWSKATGWSLPRLSGTSRARTRPVGSSPWSRL
jgi:hypothetical protein